MTVFIITLIVVANVLGSGMAYPQAARIVRTGNIEGVSASWAGVSIAMNLWWLVYGAANGLWGLVPTSAIAGVIYLVIAVAYVRLAGRRALATLTLGAFGVGSLPLIAIAVAGWEAAGIAIGLCYGLQLAPAIIASLRTRELAGIAAATWVMAWAESVIWFAYGLYVVDGALLVGGGSGLAMATIILVRLAVTGHEPFRVARPAFTAA